MPVKPEGRYYFYGQFDDKFHEIEAMRAYEVNGFELFLAHFSKDLYAVFDATGGHAVGHGSTAVKAVRDVSKWVRECGVEKARESIKNCLLQHSASPRVLQQAKKKRKEAVSA